MIAEPLLEVRALTRRFGGVTALDGADLVVAAGKITGLIGPNGAGKTTLFNAVSGAMRPDAGQVLLAGVDVTGWRPERLARSGMARTFQLSRGLSNLTVLENVMLYGRDQPGETVMGAILGGAAARAHEAALRERALSIAERLDLTQVGDNRAADLSGGQKKLLELGRVLMADPKLILLDEPTAGVNPSLAKRLVAHIRTLRDQGLTFLVVEHNMSIIGDLCDHVVVLAQGRRLTEGRFEEVRADARVQQAYLGLRL